MRFDRLGSLLLDNLLNQTIRTPRTLNKIVYSFCSCILRVMGWENVVDIATRYGLDGLGIESLWGQDFPQKSIPALGPNQPPIKWVPCLFPRGKATGAFCRPPTPSSAEVKERVELYLFSASRTSWTVLGCPLPLS